MDPLNEQRLRDEVTFLHSLWHQGPPAPRPPSAATRHHLHPSKATLFKKKPNPTGKRWKILPHDATSSHSAEWPCPATPPPATAWPTACGPTPEPLLLSPEEQSKLAAKRAHHDALKVVRDFLITNNPDGFDETEGSDDDDGDEPMAGDRGCEEYGIFYKVFEDTILKEYYEKNFVMGEFSCLVCGVVVGGKNSTKKFKGCLPLVQHSITIEKTKRRRAHRAFAQAVCKVLGWDIHRLPEIVSMLSDKSGNTQGNSNGDNKESLVALSHNVDSVKHVTSYGKANEAEPASHSGENLEDIGVVNALPDNEEPASDGLTVSFSATVFPSAAVPMVSHHLQPSEAECPCPSPPHLPPTSGWPTTGLATLEKSSLKALPPSFEEQLILAARHAHQHALKVVHEFFRTDKSNDSDEIDSESDDGDDDELMEEDSGSEKYSVFLKVFEEGTELREYYMKNFSEGEFSCLVCGAVGGKRSGKTFKGCLPLVQHSITIAKTKKRKPHRAFGRAVCKVLGWDIDCLHDIAGMLSDKTGKIQDSKEDSVSSVHNVDLVKPNDDTLEGKNDEAAPESGRVCSGIPSNSDDGDMNLTCPDADRNLGNGNLHAHSLEDPIAE
ncbi:uncharacterized protein LOC130986898 [Salvia miltiorrhiza]|uniref:uncharacterized protein LOC130986898 n=1 Tax=Salvia miltiorrhiza TaxID=226208 RepID=UPI0025AC9495|nr:uncharacterized protein LOC130986898 [Salvia miltiorrhiza]XP_057766421.1 uncharacterized protein LOC130986898 [Salvia miltiorrhiza]